MVHVAPDGKITPDTPDVPKEAAPASADMKGGPIEAAADKTAQAAVEANAAHSVLANPGGMSGGADVEVKEPGGMKMPTAGNGPSFAGNYMEAVKTLDALRTNASADSLATPGTPAQQLTGGFTPEFEPPDDGKPKYGFGLRSPHSRFHPSELAKGVKIEMEHTTDPKIALEIAKDHLMELSDYYTRLEKMMKEAHTRHKKKVRKTQRNGRGRKRTNRRK
jgi:hypothetical protein